MSELPPLVEAITGRLESLSPTQQRVAQYILRNPTSPAFMNARELGEAVGASESSIVRFAYAVGFDGYRDLQASAQQQLSSRLSLHERYLSRSQLPVTTVHTAVRSSIRNLQELQETLSAQDLEQAAERIIRARRCYVVGFRAAAGLAIIASSAIGQLCHNCVQLSLELGETIDLLVGAGDQDVLLAITFRRYSRRTLQIAKYLHSLGTFVIGITDCLWSPLRDSADILLVGEVESPSYAYSLTAPHCIIDCLVLALSQKMGIGAATPIKEWEETYRYFDLLEGM